MSEQVSTDQETELSTNDELNTQKPGAVEETETTEQVKKPLRERVFAACEELITEGRNVTRDSVREKTRGSDRDLSQYIKEWRAAKAASNTQTSEGAEDIDDSETAGKLVVQNKNDIVSSKNDNNIQTPDQVVQTVKTRVVKKRNKSLGDAVRDGANQAAGVLVTEERVFQSLLENPDLLPLDLKQEVEKAMNDSDELMKSRSARFELSFFVEDALSSLRGNA
ncbi:hypothetical protein NIES4071_106530 (plasmid) [Calothrix sp. NIES-4071]|nr:hypothetical protein NIES4071_106530 [Calothrix sp. NIES-4071]BAZ65071.1 hypothetical protein NIES4105_108040 [Calothrix sp. NIES-4105]